MITSLFDLAETQAARNNTTVTLELGRWIGIFQNVPLFAQFYMSVQTAYTVRQFVSTSGLEWYWIVLGLGYFLWSGFLVALLYGHVTVELVSQTLGFFSEKPPFGGRLFGIFLIAVLIIGIFPYIAIVGGMGILYSFNLVATFDWQGILVWGFLNALLSVIAPGLMSDTQTLPQKRSSFYSRILRSALKSVTKSLENNPIVAFKVLNIDIDTGDFIRDSNRIIDILKDVDPKAASLAEGRKKRGQKLFLRPPEVYYEPSTSITRNESIVE